MAGCAKTNVDIPGVTDEPLTAAVTVMDLPETAPAYGVVADGSIEVNLEAQDGSRVRRGQEAWVTDDASARKVECRVTGVIPDANLATGQAIAWLKPRGGKDLPSGDFVSAEIILGVKQGVMALPRDAIYIRDGKTMVLLKQAGKDGAVNYVPTVVETGAASDKDIEILSGLRPGDEVATQAGIGYLYPDFKANADD